VEQTRTASGVVLGAANVLAYVDGSQRIHVLDVDSKRELVRPIELETPVRAIHWTANGRDLVVITSGALLRVALGEDDPSNPYRGLRPASLIAAEPSPQRASEVAALALRSGGSSERQSELLLLRDEATSSLSSGPGRFTDIAWSPDGRWLLLAWRDADQWLFLRPGADPGRSVIPVDNISSQFDPGGSGPAGFPRIAGWCCVR
jgi:hypothetical protein